MPKLTIGLPPERNIFLQIERYEPLMMYIGEKSGVRFEMKVLPSYMNIVESFRSLGLDGAFFGSYTYVLANRLRGVVAVARPETLDGVSTYHGMIFVKKGSPIRTGRDLKGKRMVMAGSATTAGHLLSLVFFAQNGIEDPKGFLKELYFAGTHEDAIHDVLEGRADIGAAKNTVLQRMLTDGGASTRGIRVLAVSPEVPENGLAFRPDIDKDLIRRIRQTLLSMDRDPEGARILKEFGARRFIETRDEDYDIVRMYAGKAGIDPAAAERGKQRP